MSRKSAARIVRPPTYLERFKYEKEPNLDKTQYLAFKRGGYSLEKEEVELQQLMKDIRTKSSEVVQRRIMKIGLLNFSPKKERIKEETS